jgi:tetratricopeptide (TPR) repeat protein
MSLTNVSECAYNLGRNDEALESAEEAVAIRRRLADARLHGILPLLAWSLKTLGQAHAQARRPAEAAHFFEEGLAIIAPLVERYGQGISDVTVVLRQGYLNACKEAGMVPDIVLLERVARLLDVPAESTPHAQ